MQIWEPEELKLPSKTTGSARKEDRNERVLLQPRRAKQVVSVPYVNHIFIFVEMERPTEYVRDAVQLIYDCYIAELTTEIGAVMLPGRDV